DELKRFYFIKAGHCNIIKQHRDPLASDRYRRPSLACPTPSSPTAATARAAERIVGNTADPPPPLSVRHVLLAVLSAPACFGEDGLLPASAFAMKTPPSAAASAAAVPTAAKGTDEPARVAHYSVVAGDVRRRRGGRARSDGGGGCTLLSMSLIEARQLFVGAVQPSGWARLAGVADCARNSGIGGGERGVKVPASAASEARESLIAARAERRSWLRARRRELLALARECRGDPDARAGDLGVRSAACDHRAAAAKDVRWRL
ncbi:hypothetical protein HK405_008377, partial [Cladochytrium tenue]